MSDRFDPQATEDEASSKSQLVSNKDFRVLAIIFFAILALLYPVYLFGRKKSQKAICVQNFKAMFDAVNLYARDHDDGLPPLYRADDKGMPALGESGLPYTWASDVSQYMNPRASFRCPSATDAEVVKMESGDAKKPIECAYGMYSPYGGVKTYNIESPDTTVILTETSNLGAEESFDPLPFMNGDQKLPDGFVIAWDNSNLNANKQTKRVTRIAFRGTDPKTAIGRHDEGVHALTATGEMFIMKADGVLTSPRPDKLPGGTWNVPARERLQ